MINIIVSSDPRYKINREVIKLTVLSVLQRHRISGRMELGINIVGDRKMHELNRKYRRINSTTDILSFALEEIPRVGFIAAPDKILRLGDIVISYPQALEDASADSISIDEEIKNLVGHGIQHLLGIHHG